MQVREYKMTIDNTGDLFFEQHLSLPLSIMYASIESTMKKESLHTFALLLSIYTEVFGGIVTGKLQDNHSMRKNYEKFLEFLGSHYVALNEKYDLYANVRSKLVHEFAPRPSYVIWVSSLANSNKFGIEVTNGNLNINLSEYYRDLKIAVDKYRIQLGFEPELILNLQKALQIDWNNVILKPKNALCTNCNRSWREELDIGIDGNTWAKTAICPQCNKLGHVSFIDNENDPTRRSFTG